MKILGIDYGSKRIGIALADTEAGMAFPKTVLQNDKDLLKHIQNFIKEEGVSKIVMGESRNLDGSENEILKDSKVFKEELEKALDIEVVFEPEFYSTYGATRIQGDHDKIDASAAAIILQSYLDKMKNNQ